MKKTVLTFGLISGGILTAMMVIPPLISKDIAWSGAGEIIGYATMVLAGIMVFMGVKSYRDNYNESVITFGKAFKVALLITLVSTIIYVLVWQILSETIYSDFMERYSAAMVKKAQESGLTPEQLAAKKAEMEQMAEMYKNPLFRIAITFIEPLPVGILMSLVAAFVFKKKAVAA